VVRMKSVSKELIIELNLLFDEEMLESSLSSWFCSKSEKI